jgi:hypothetical protein
MGCKHRELSRVGYEVWECQECGGLYSLVEVDGFMEEDEDEECEEEEGGECGDENLERD